MIVEGIERAKKAAAGLPERVFIIRDQDLVNPKAPPDKSEPVVPKNLIDNSALWKDIAIFITFDEGGGYYDSGYVQPVDFFGDGPRIPLIVVSPYAKGGRVVHDYSDHVSILKFIEANWALPTVTARSRDNFPNPIATEDNPYVPTNSPALDDLVSMFTFPSK